MYNDNDDFFLDDSELFEDNQLSLADKAKIKVLEKFKEKLDEAINNIEYLEKSEYRSNLNIIARFVGEIMQIEQMEEAQKEGAVTEEQLLEAIETIEMRIKEITISDLQKLENKNETVEVNTDNTKGGIDDDFDF
jgi:hypothetical protein